MFGFISDDSFVNIYLSLKFGKFHCEKFRQRHLSWKVVKTRKKLKKIVPFGEIKYY